MPWRAAWPPHARHESRPRQSRPPRPRPRRRTRAAPCRNSWTGSANRGVTLVFVPHSGFSAGRRGGVAMRGTLKWFGRILLALVLAAAVVGLWKREEIARLWAVNTLFSADRIVANFSGME